MGILSGVVSYLFGLSLNLLDAAIGGFLGALGFDLDTFENYFPAAREFHDVIIGFAVGLLFIMLIFQIFRNFGVMLDVEAEDPLKMLGKIALFFGMILYSRSIVNMILGLLTDPYAIFLNTASTPYEFELLTLVTSMFTSVFSNPFMSIVTMILMLVMGWQFLKLTVECVERYIVFYFVLYCAPVVFAVGAFKSTAQIFKSWCRMLASQAVLLLLNIWSIKLFLSFMPVFERNAGDIIFNFLLGYAFLKFAQKADTLLRILGLNTASTGDMVRSLGGTIASIAMAVKSAGSMARGVNAAAGRLFGAANPGTTTGSGGSGGEISGMRSGAGGPQPSGGSGSNGASVGGITDSGISSAKRSYASDVLNAARLQMDGVPESSGGEGGSSEQTDLAGDRRVRTNAPDTERVKMAQTGAAPDGRASAVKDPHKVDGETVEGLSNLAHGLPHDKYDPVKGSFSGGGFPEFTGENANIIGASQLTPAEGVHQSIMKMADGTTGTVYRNAETGEASVVQFASVDNGVLQGTISQLDPATGKMGEDFAFMAVHSSVPGASSFSASSIPIRDASGGAYHVATGADTNVFSAISGVQAGSSAFTPGGTSKMAAPEKGAAVTAHLAGKNFSVTANSVDGVAASPISGGGIASGGVAGVESAVSSRRADSISAPGSAPEHSAFAGASGSSLAAETPLPNQSGAGSPPIQAGMAKDPQNQVRRFSRSNPANVEVFRRDSGLIESFDKTQPGADAVSRIDPPANPKTERNDTL